MNLLQAINPVAFSLGPIEVRWYGVIIACGIVLAFIVAQREMVKRGFRSRIFDGFTYLGSTFSNCWCTNILCHF